MITKYLGWISAINRKANYYNRRRLEKSMCTVSDIVLEVKTLTDGEIYSIRTLQEIRDTFPKKM